MNLLIKLCNRRSASLGISKRIGNVPGLAYQLPWGSLSRGGILVVGLHPLGN